MNIIEQAARRLEELKRAGVEMPWEPAELAEPQAPATARPIVFAAPPAASAPPATPVEQARPDVARPSQAAQKSVTIDLELLARLGYLVPGQHRTALANEFQAIKRPLLKNARTDPAQPVKNGNLIMVTSAMPGEGKTYCAVNLAMSLAMEVDTTVLLVDSDVVRPAIMQRLGVTGDHPGLLDVLSDPAVDLDSVILRTNVDKLLLLPPGHQRFDSTELLASDAMRRMLEAFVLRHPDQIAIFDAPPLLVTTESKVLASRVGQILVVVDQGRTHPRDVSKAFGILGEMPNVVSVLNKSRAAADRDKYGYYEA